MNKKLLYSLLAGVLSVSMLAACGDVPEEGDVPGGDEQMDMEDPLEGQ